MVGSDHWAQQQQQHLKSKFGYECPEYEVPQDGEYYEYQARQRHLTEREGVEQSGYQYQEEYQH